MSKATVGTIKADESGDGYLTLTAHFENETAMYRADVLKDALADLLDAYNEARKACGWVPVMLIACDEEAAE